MFDSYSRPRMVCKYKAIRTTGLGSSGVGVRTANSVDAVYDLQVDHLPRERTRQNDVRYTLFLATARSDVEGVAGT